MNRELMEQAREAMRNYRDRPSKERFDEMVRRGVIDKDGNVLIRQGGEPHNMEGSESGSGR